MVGVQFTTEQRTFVLLEYNKTRSPGRVIERFEERFLDRQPPCARTILRNFPKYSTQGTSLNRNVGHSGRRRTARLLNNINTVSEALRHDPRISTRYPARRLAFCTWLVERNADFWANLVIGDEASFQMNACVSSRNVLEYAPRGYPPMHNYHRRDSRQKWMVWVGLCGNGEVVGPLFFPGNVNREAYLDMLNNNIVHILSQHYEVQANRVFQRVWWAQDGTPAHR
ncbi:Hypothetical predicted protein [Paramuricea clavata]|uniref:Uncharacterized protein n=1 Tax=Paramuricea clavata TaxID=317549 RepID=A0A7D9EFB9_PARCT|nr:Hypothetical predicted protein [Paramuricea clavata]